MKIIVDAMGGDFAPLAPVKGALMAHERYGAEILLAGKEEEIQKTLRECGCAALPTGVEIVNATEVVEICDDPATAFKRKKDSSLTVGLTMLHNGEADGFVSAGSTGGLRRAALAPTIPTATGRAVLIDCGANAECTVEYLLQFAYLGSYYAQKVLGVETPRVGLLNIGAEESKGDTLRRETYQKLREAGEAGHLNFVGNIEAKEALLGACDVIVADGYSGNIMLKSIEGTGKLFPSSSRRCSCTARGRNWLHCCSKAGLRTLRRCSTQTKSAARRCSAFQSPSSRRTAARARSASATRCVRRWRSRAAASLTTSRKTSTRCGSDERQNAANAQKRKNGY